MAVITEKIPMATKVAKITHRYFCDACTGIAFYLHKDEIMPTSGICLSCGKALTVKKENFIKI